MAIPLILPEIPLPRPWQPTAGIEMQKKLKVELGEAINAIPLEGEMFLNFTTSLGKVSGVNASLAFQLRKWGFWRGKILDWIFVSPVFREYYELTIRQAEALAAEIKTGLASIATAISDFELIWHDLRKYKEFMDYFEMIERGKREKKPELVMRGEQTLKAIFIDQVDVHTGEGIALKLIAPRWPTIIADFMKLTDEDVDPKKIAKKLKVSEAEGVVLATKNKLYVEWRDELFKPTVVTRYKELLGLKEARLKSIETYKEMLRPTIARWKMINDALTSPARAGAILTSWARPDAQAISADYMIMWAWRPFAPAEKYKVIRSSFDEIHPLEAGFTMDEIVELQEKGVIDKKNPVVYALPQEPSIDRIVRACIPEIEREYGVKITSEDIWRARNMLVEQFRASIPPALTAIEAWVWSPYFLFLNIPILRGVLKLPDGSQIEDVEYGGGKGGGAEGFYCATRTQNFIIVNCLELVAREKQLENYIRHLLGEMGISEKRLMEIEEMAKKEFPRIYKTEEEIKKEKEREEKLKKLSKIKAAKLKMFETFRKIRFKISRFFGALGIPVQFLRAVGPYEFAMHHRLAKYYQLEAGRTFALVRDFLKTKFETPGIAVPW